MMMSSSSTPRSSCGGGGAGSSNNSSNSNNSLGIDTGGGAGSCVVATTTTTNSSTTTSSSSHPCSLFTPHQWQELEHQALVFKHFISGVPVPPYLLSSVRRSLLDSSSLSRPFSLSSSSVPQQNQQSSFGAWGSTCFQMGFTDLSSGVVSGGRRQDPEPGRCRRTDGKKWRCSKEAAYPDSKYCEKHMHRGKHRAKANKQQQQQPPLPPQQQQQQQQQSTAAAAAAGFTTSPTSTLLTTPSLLLSKTSSNSSSITCSSSSPSSSATFQNVNVPLNCYNFYNQNSHHPTISDYTNAFNYIQNTQQYPSSSAAAAAAGTGNYTTSSNTNYQGDGGGGEGSSSPYNYNFLTSNYGNNPGLQSHQGSCRDDNNNLLLGSGSRDLQFHHDKINSSLSRQYWCSSGGGNGEERSFFPVADETCSRSNKVGRGGDHHHHQGDQLSGGVYLGYTANNNSTIKEGIGGVDEDSNGDEVVVKDDGKNPYHQFFGEIWPVKNASNWVGGDEDGSDDLNTNSNNNATAVVGCSTSTQLSISIPPHNSYCRGRDG